MLPSVRLGLGAGFVREDVGFGAGFGAQVQLGAQLHLVSVPRRPIVFLQPLAGYAHVGVSSGPLNAFTLGLGVGVGGRLLRGMLRPQVVLGGYGPSFTAGARTSVALEVWMGALGIEAGHDYLGLGGGGRHGGHLMLTTDLIAVGLVAVRRWWQG
ncbi:MAG: hypothetical protein H6713_03370 [Myxococcales bacterium]|nr:hypothetical protein [Myxococcales bacterium]